MMVVPETGFFSCNSATVKLFRCKDEEDFCRYAPADLSPEYQPDSITSAVKAQQMMAAAMEKGSHFFEWTHKRTDGNEFFANVLLTRMELEGRTVLQATVRDITPLKKAQEALSHYAAELEEKNRELQELMEEVRSLSLIDELTQLYNRRGFVTLAHKQLQIADRMRRAVTLLYFDLDKMKEINDNLGHNEGDNALRDAAQVLKNTFRNSDIISRIGGDEFVVMMIESPNEDAESFILRLREDLNALNSRKNRPYQLSLSMGSAKYNPEFPCTIDELLAQADNLMYQNKKARQTS